MRFNDHTSFLCMPSSSNCSLVLVLPTSLHQLLDMGQQRQPAAWLTPASQAAADAGLRIRGTGKLACAGHSTCIGTGGRVQVHPVKVTCSSMCALLGGKPQWAGVTAPPCRSRTVSGKYLLCASRCMHCCKSLLALVCRLTRIQKGEAGHTSGAGTGAADTEAEAGREGTRNQAGAGVKLKEPATAQPTSQGGRGWAQVT
jgi:hypothetical protein